MSTKNYLLAIILLVAAFEFSGLLLSSSSSIKLLENMGFTDIEELGNAVAFLSLRGCAVDDNIRFDFRAKNPTVKIVEIQVCRGFFKGATIRN